MKRIAIIISLIVVLALTAFTASLLCTAHNIDSHQAAVR